MTGPGQIVGTKGWTFTLAGQVPPGVSDADIQTWVLNAVTIAVALVQYITVAEVKVADHTPPPGGQGLRLHQ